MTTIDTLRQALSGLADQAPSPDLLDHSPWTSGAERGQPQSRTPHRVLALLASAAAAVAVTALIVTVAGDGRRADSPGGVAVEPAYAAQLFGSNSMPGLELDNALIGRHRQVYLYDTPEDPYSTLTFELDVVTPDATLESIARRGTPTVIGAATGWYSTNPLTASNTVFAWLYAPAPAAKFAGRRVREVATLTWPIDATHWAILMPAYAPNDNQVLSRVELASRAASIVRDNSYHLAAVHVGYVPAGLYFTSAVSQPVSRSASAAVHLRSGPSGISGTASRLLTFTATPTAAHPDPAAATLAIEIIDETSAASVMNDLMHNGGPQIYGTSWTKTTINGHTALVAPRAILIQWGDLIVGISSSSRFGNDRLLAPGELMKVATSLRTPVTFNQDGYPLASAVPSATLK